MYHPGNIPSMLKKINNNNNSKYNKYNMLMHINKFF